MKAAFIETTGFTKSISEFLPDDTFERFQQELMANPIKGKPIPGCGGLRKVRVSDPGRGKGKRGGARIIYLYMPETKWFYLIDIYGKNEKEDLSAAEKKVLRQMAEDFAIQAKQTAARWKGSKKR